MLEAGNSNWMPQPESNMNLPYFRRAFITLSMIGLMRQHPICRGDAASRWLPMMLAVFFSLTGTLDLRSSDYQGNVGKQPARFALTWHDDGSVEGTYSYPARPGVLYTLRGDNHAEGKLYLEEYTGTELTARCFLEKTLTDGEIFWSGVMQNLDGREFAMAFSRERPAAPQPSWETNYRQSIITAMNGLPETITWSDFPYATQPVAMVSPDGVGTYLYAQVKSFRQATGWSELTLVCGIPQAANVDQVDYAGREIVWQVARALPFPSEKIIGEPLMLFVAEQGGLRDVYLPSLVITHWRKTPAGPIEVRGALGLHSDPVMEQLESEDASAADAARLLASVTPFQVIPDKLAIDELVTGEISFRDMRVNREHGILLQKTSAGPGIIELESLSLDAPSEEIPWIFIGKDVPGDLVPVSQRIAEAG
jgi:hypothetical protein